MTSQPARPALNGVDTDAAHHHGSVLSPDPPAPSTVRRWAAVLVVCIGVAMSFINVSSTITVLTLIQDGLHSSPSQLVWIASVYSLVVVSLVMSTGTLGDLIGRRRVFVIGAVVMMGGSLVAFFSHSSGLLIGGEAVLGIGGAMVLPTSLSIVSHTFTDPAERVGAISVWAGFAGLGLCIGPVVSGVLVEHFSWHAVFMTDVCLGVAAAVLAPLVASESRHPTQKLDPAGVLLSTIALAAGTYAIIEGANLGYGDGQIVTMYIVCGMALFLFIGIELHAKDPMLDLRLFKSRSFAAVMGVATTTMFGFVGVALLSVLYIETVRQISPIGTAARLLVMFGAYIVMSVVASRLSKRLGVVVLLTAGLIGLGAGSLALLAIGPFNGFSHMWFGLLLSGIGSGLLVGTSTAAAVNSVAPNQAGMASNTVNMFRQLGSVLGPAVLGTIVTSRFPRTLDQHLVNDGLPQSTAGQIVRGATHGASPASIPKPIAPTALYELSRSFTSAVHLGLLVGGLVLLAMAVPTVLFVRQRTGAAAAPAPAQAPAPAPAPAEIDVRDEVHPSRSRTYGWVDPALVTDLTTRTRGIDLLNALAEGRAPTAPAMATAGIEAVEFSEGRAVVALTPAEWHYNPMGTVHGGMLTMLADSAMGYAVTTRVEPGRGFTTLDLKVSFTRPATIASGRLTATATVVTMGRRTSTVDVRIVDAEGRVVAHGDSTCLLLDPVSRA